MRSVLIYKSIVQVGGAERFLFEFFRALQKKQEVVILCKNYDEKILAKYNFNKKHLICPKNENYLNWFFFLVKNLKKSDEILVQSGFKDIYITKLFTGIKYRLFIHHPHFHTLLHGEVLSFLHRRNRKLFLQDEYNKRFFDEIKKTFSKKWRITIELNAILTYLSFRAASNSYVLSNYAVKEKMEYFGIKSKRLVPGVTNTYLNEVEKKCKKENQLIFFGRLTKEKRVDLLIKSFKKLNKKYILKIIGTGPELDNLIHLSKGDDRICFKGFLPDEELIDEIKKSLLFITLQWADFNLTVYESIALGTRVLFGQTNEVEDFDLQFLKSKMLFYTDLDESSILREIENILELPNVKNSDYSFIKKYSWDHYVKNFLDEI
jgi:glycosyltransferase involved in cell wall biosynthesis